MSVRALGLGPALRQAALAPRLGMLVHFYAVELYLTLWTQRLGPHSSNGEHPWLSDARLTDEVLTIFACYSSIQTQSLPPSAEVDILNKQRLHRPSAPHYTIYQPQLTWVPSIAHRITGSGLSICTYP